MPIQLTKDSIDLGIVTNHPQESLAFYRDVLGFEYEMELKLPGITMQRLYCGTSLIKLVTPDKQPDASAPPGGIVGATGYRYWTMSVSNLDEVVAECEAAGRKILTAPREIRPGVRMAMVDDPDGNWVEFIETS